VCRVCSTMMNIPYTGSGPIPGARMALNKFHSKQILRSAGLPSAKDYLHYPGSSAKPSGGSLPVMSSRFMRMPVSASMPVPFARTLSTSESDRLTFMRSIHQAALVEEYLEGREFNVSIMGSEPEVLAIQEIDFTGMPDGEPKIVSYRAKWDEDSPAYGAYVCRSVLRISPKRLEKRIRDIALRSYKCIGCRDYARVDMRTDAVARRNPYSARS